jgi:hypothetical protein
VGSIDRFHVKKVKNGTLLNIFKKNILSTEAKARTLLNISNTHLMLLNRVESCSASTAALECERKEKNVQRTLDAVPESSTQRSDVGAQNDVYWLSCPLHAADSKTNF